MTFKDYKKELTGIEIQKNKHVEHFFNESKAFCVAVALIQQEIDPHFSLGAKAVDRQIEYKDYLKSFSIQ